MAQTPSSAANRSADNTPPLIRLENICKSYGPVKANRNISLEIR